MAQKRCTRRVQHPKILLITSIVDGFQVSHRAGKNPCPPTRHAGWRHPRPRQPRPATRGRPRSRSGADPVATRSALSRHPRLSAHVLGSPGCITPGKLVHITVDPPDNEAPLALPGCFERGAQTNSHTGLYCSATGSFFQTFLIEFFSAPNQLQAPARSFQMIALDKTA